MVFAPRLEGGFAFNQPTQAPNAMGALASLFNFGVDTLQTEAKAAAEAQPKPTKGDQFDMAIGEFINSKGAVFQEISWDKKSAREFIFQNPQFATEMKSYLEGTGVFDTPQAVAEDASMKIFETPEGQLAVAAASGMEPEEQQAYLAEFATTYAQQNAELARVQREAATLEANGTIDAKRWDALKPVAKDNVDRAVSVVLGPIIQDVKNGISVEVSEELKQLIPGLRYDTITMDNLGAVLQDAKIYMTQQARGAYVNNFGVDVLPSEEWSKEVFNGLDGLITIAETFDTKPEQAALLSAVIEADVLKKLDSAGLATTIKLLEMAGPVTADALISNLKLAADPRFASLFADSDGTLFSVKEIADAVNNGSKGDAEKNAKDSLTIIDSAGISVEFFTAFKESAKRSGYDVVDSNSFKSLIGNNIEEIKRLSTTNPEFRASMSDFLNSDIQQTISVVNSNLPDEIKVVMQKDGKFALTYAGTLPERTAREKLLIPDNEFRMSAVRNAEKNLPDGLNLTTLNEKIGALGLLGDVGKEVQESIGMLNTPEAKAGTRKATAGGGRARGRRKVTPEEVITGLTARSMPEHIAEGFAINMADESGLDTGVNEANPTVEGSRGGFGLIQWTGPRRKALEAFASEQGKSVDDFDLQLDFLVQELGGAESAAWQRISTATTKEEAAALILNEFLRPAEKHRAAREAEYLGGAGGFEQRSGTTGEAGKVSLDTGAEGIPTTPNAPSKANTDALKGDVISYDSPEIQSLIEASQKAPQEVVKMAKELLSGKPIDPQVKSLIEALIRVGEKQ